MTIGVAASGSLAPVSAQVPPIDDGTQVVVVDRGGTPVTTRVLREAPSPDNGLPSRAGSIIVKFRAGVSPAQQDGLHRQAGASQIEAIGLANTQRVQVASGSTAQALAMYRARPDVEYAEPDYISHVSWQPNDTSFSQQWGLTKINAPAAWDVTQSSSAVRVAVLDCGIFSASSAWGDANGFPNGHPDIAPKVIQEQNFTTSATVDDICNHGTHVAGIAAAMTNNATGVAGVAPNARVVNVKVCGDTGSCSSSAIANGILWAAGCETGSCGARRADVINMSFGGEGDCSQTRQNAINTAWSQGLVLVAAAGNEGTTAPSTPANCENVLSVAATGSTDLRASFSNYGPWVDVAAPGVSILSTVAHGGYANFNGTSMATPIVAGLAALLWTTPHNTSNAALVQRIISTSNASTVTGSVYGRIDALAAVTSGSGSGLPAPSNVSLTSPTSNGLTVLFKDNATTETGIDIERKPATGGTWAVAITTNPLPGASDGWWWENTGLSSGTQYCYRLRTKAGTTYSAYTGEVCASTSAGSSALGAPSNLSVIQPTSSSLTVLFKDNATNETGIDIERRTPGGNWAVVITTNPLPGTSDGWWWENTGLSSGTQYCYRLRAKNGSTYSAYTGEVCASTSAGALGAPSNVSVTSGGGNSLIVAFRDNATTETGIDIERRTASVGWAVVITTNPLPGATDGWWWQNTGLAANTQYCYRLRAKNGSSFSAYSNEVCSTTVSSAGGAPSSTQLAPPTSLPNLAPWREAAPPRSETVR